MQDFKFDLQRFTLTFEFTSGTKTFEDRGNIGGDGKHYDIYQYYPTEEWNEYFQYQNYKTIKLTAINEYRCYPVAISHGWQDWQETVPGESFSGDYRILRGGNKEYHALENHQASYVKMYGRNDGAVLNNDGGNYALMVGGTGNDYITNSGNFVEINAGAGGDYISNSAGNHVTIDAGDDEGSDTVGNSGSSVQIVTGAGMDSITNSVSDVKIETGVGNDSIQNTGNSNVTIDGGAGDDYIQNSGDNVKILAGNNNDRIENKGIKVTIDAGADAGRDTVENSGSSVQIIAGSGADLIKNSGSDVNIDAGADAANDTVENSGSNVEIATGAGMDSITNSGSGVKIYAGVGNDEIRSEGGSNVTIDGGADDDTIHNSSSNAKILAGNNNDKIENQGTKVTIDSGTDEGCDTVENSGSNVEIATGAGMDSITNSGSDVKIETGVGNDSIQNTGNSNVTIDGGAGDDHIGNQGDKVTIKSGAGNDSVYNTGNNISIDATGGTASNKNLTYNEGSSVTITGGDAIDSIITNSKSKNVTVNAGGDNDNVSIFGGENISVNAGAKDDTVIVYGEYTGGMGNSPLVTYGNYSGNYLTIDAGGGKNFVSVASSWRYVTIEGGDDLEGVDAILNDGENALLKGNKGNDYIRNTSDYAVIFGGDDGDIIENYGNHVYIQGDDSTGNSSHNVGDYIYTDEGNNVTVDGGANNDTITAYHDVRGSIVGGSGNDYISLQRLSAYDVNKLSAAYLNIASKAFSHWLKGTPLQKNLTLSDNEADWLITLGIWDSELGELAGKSPTPLGVALSVVDTAKGLYEAWQDFKNFAAYIGDLSSTSTVIGGAGNDTIISDGVAPRVFEYYNGHDNDVIYHFAVDSTLKSALNLLSNDNFTSTLDIKLGRIKHIAVIGNDVTFVVGTGSIKLVDGANKKFKLVEDEERGSVFTRAYGINYDTGAVVCSLFGSAADEYIQDNVGIKRDKTTYIGVDVERQDTTIGETFANVIYGYGGSDNLRGNDKDDTIYGGVGNDYIFGGGGNDVLYGNEEADKIYGGEGNDKIYSDEGDTVDGGAGDDYIQNSGDNVSISAGDDNDTVENYGNKVTIETDAGNDKIVNHGSNVTINTGNGNDSIQVGNITGSDSNVTFNIKVNAGANNDTVESYVSNVTIAGEVGDDLIILSAGADRNFIDYKDGDGHDEIRGLTDDDTLKISSGKVSKATVEGSDVILMVGAGSVRFKNFSNKEFKITAADGEIFKYKLFADSVTKELVGSIVGGKGQTTLYGTSGSDRFYGSNTDDLIFGNGGNDNLYGESGNDSIYGGDGNDNIFDGSGTNTLIGGKGNDTIYAGGINNLIIYNYGDGNDRVFGSGKLRILGASYSSLESQGNMILKVGDNEIILVNNSNGRYFKVEGDFAGELAPEGTYLDGDTLRFKENYSDNTFDANNISLPIKGIDASLLNKGITVFSNGSIDLFTGSKFSDVYYCDMNSADSPAKTFLMAEDSAEVSPATIKAGGGNDTIFGGERENLYVYSAGDGDDVIYNVGGADALSVLGGTYARSINDNDLIVKVGSGSVTFKNAATQTLNILGEEEDWHLDGTTATFGDSITLTGIKSLEGVTFDGNKTVTLSEAALNEENVTITKGYTLKIADDVPTSSKKIAATWTEGDDGFTYTAAGTPAYYKLSSNKLTFTPAKGGEQFTLTGIADTKGVKVSGKKVTVGKAALGDSDITLTTEDGFKLALDKSVTEAKEIKSGWKKSTYTAAGTTAGYALNGDTISYSEPVGGEQFTISGLKNTNDVTVEDYVVTIGAGSLNGKKVTFTGNEFAVVLGDDVPTEAEEVEGKFTSVAKGTATYRTAHVSEAYTLGDGTIEFTPAVGGQDVKISNLNKTATEEEVADAIDIVEGDSGLQIIFTDAAVLTTKAPTISAPKGVEYTVAVDEALSIAKESLKWNTKGTAATLSADTGATYTVKSNKVVYTKAKAGKAQAVLTGLAKAAKLATPDAEEKVITLDAENLGTKTSLKSNAGGYSIELTGDMIGKTFVGSATADTIDVAANNALVDGGKGNDEFTISGASVTILSSAGNDVANFADGLTVSLSGTTTVKELAQTDSGVQLTFSNKATLNVTDVTDTFDVVGKKQTFTVDTDKFSLGENLTFGKGSVTVAADFTGSITPDDDIYLGGKLSTVTTIDASAVTEGISIDGNAKANVIYGGAGDDKLWGDKGNDTLIGGDGADTFIYNSGEGKDVISGFTDDDLLEITGNFTTSYNSSKNEIALKVGKGSLTLKDFTATEFNIGDDTYSISGNKLAK